MKHESTSPGTTVWLTPPHIIDALGGWESFDLDPCACSLPRPWPTARRMNSREDANGLQIRWHGRVLLNPPFTDGEVSRWLGRMVGHGRGTVVLGARTDTKAWHRYVWEEASGLLFMKGRVYYCRPDGSVAKRNAGHPTVLAAYGQDDLDRLAACELPGRLVPLRFARFVLVEALGPGTWSDEMISWLRRQRGPVDVSDAYRAFARHPKAARNPNWQAKVRQKLREHARRVGPALYEAAA